MDGEREKFNSVILEWGAACALRAPIADCEALLDKAFNIARVSLPSAQPPHHVGDSNDMIKSSNINAAQPSDVVGKRVIETKRLSYNRGDSEYSISAAQLHEHAFTTTQQAQSVQPFDKERVASKAASMFGSVDTEQMMRTVKALRELNMSPFTANK